jgi:putative transcriptional regulator
MGAWIVVPSKVDDVFTDNPEALWAEVLSRQPGRVSWLASIPKDLTTN